MSQTKTIEESKRTYRSGIIHAGKRAELVVTQIDGGQRYAYLSLPDIDLLTVTQLTAVRDFLTDVIIDEETLL